MVMADRWLLPDGVDESLPEQVAKIEQLRRILLDLHATWGYKLVIPPLFKYLDSWHEIKNLRQKIPSSRSPV